MARWCNTIHQPQPETSLQDSPTPASDLTPKEELEESTTSDELDSLYSPKELENLQKYNEYLNDLSTRLEGGWPPPDTIPYDQDLLHYTLGLSPVWHPTTKVLTSNSTPIRKGIWIMKP